MSRPNSHPIPSIPIILSSLLLCAVIMGRASAAPLPDDKRLEQKVTTSVVERPLREWLAELSRKTGVRLSTSGDYEDRSIAARVREMPLRRLMESVASLYGDVWKPDPKAKEGGAYVLHASEARRSRQRKLLTAYDRTLRAELMGKARDWAAGGAPNVTFEGEEEEWREFGKRDFQGRGRVLSQLTDEEVGMLLAGETVR
ncbi:MAG TPA: hypothetical protein VK689_07440, partial [Armatimonadota bacterium]|nr:hypothetical protein [Armatimonadota bacterium]